MGDMLDKAKTLGRSKIHLMAACKRFSHQWMWVEMGLAGSKQQKAST